LHRRQVLLEQLGPEQTERAPPASLAPDALGVDGLAGSAVLPGKPVVGQVQVDACGLDRAVTGLRLDRFQGHTGLTKPREAGVSELMTRQVLDPGPGAGSGHDLVQARRGKRLPAPWPLQHEEDVIVDSV